MSMAAVPAFWQAKVQWASNGDRTRDGAHALRIAGEHYTARPGIHTGPESRGFDGAVRRWRDDAGVEYVSNDVMHQGSIPARLRNLLPDNAEWVHTNTATSNNDHPPVKDAVFASPTTAVTA
jgi:hypothetical protein